MIVKPPIVGNIIHISLLISRAHTSLAKKNPLSHSPVSYLRPDVKFDRRVRRPKLHPSLPHHKLRRGGEGCCVRLASSWTMAAMTPNLRGVYFAGYIGC